MKSFNRADRVERVEWVGLATEYTKHTKVRGCLKSDVGSQPKMVGARVPRAHQTRNPKLENPKPTDRQNLLFTVAQCTVERRSRVILQGTTATYAILRIKFDVKINQKGG